ncbi:MAG: protein phosphatase CheZ [Candidatus Kapabacteria bacterium]|nr:protein phosphatase CheZ [Candidatus Kapabacteria bacterium]
MIDNDITVILRKAEELKALFVIGQRVIPFLEEIFLFVSEIKPLLDDINHSIDENLKKMPNASKQLSKVTEATENATTEIMDTLDSLVYKVDLMCSNISRLQVIDEQKRKSPLKILEIIYQALIKEVDPKEIIPQIGKAIDNLKLTTGKDFNEIVDHSNEIANSIKDDTSSIMMALQVQDITSQQIAAVNHLLETVQEKLGIIMKRFQTTEISDLVREKESYKDKTNVSKLHRQIAFDPDAVDSITNRGTRQDEVDAVFQQGIDFTDQTDDQESDEEFDIDKLFANNPVQTQTQVTTVPILIAIEDSNDFESFNQDDIDALFGK